MLLNKNGHCIPPRVPVVYMPRRSAEQSNSLVAVFVYVIYIQIDRYRNAGCGENIAANIRVNIKTWQ